MWFKDWYEPLKFWPSTNILQLTKQQKQTNKVQSMFVAVVVGGGGGVGIFNDIWSRFRSSAEETAIFFSFLQILTSAENLVHTA